VFPYSAPCGSSKET